MSVRDEIKEFYYSKAQIIQYLLDEPPAELKSYEKRIVSVASIPPEVHSQRWTKSDKGFNHVGSVVRKIDPRTTDEMIAGGMLVLFREDEYVVNKSVKKR